MNTMFQSFDDTSNPKGAKPRVAALRKLLIQHKLNGFIVPRSDEHQGEYVPESEERLAYISGFTGSAGFTIILTQAAAVFADGRYKLQIKQQVDTRIFTPVSSKEADMQQWLISNVSGYSRIGYDPRLHTSADIERFDKILTKFSAQLVPVEHNLIDLIWHDRPPAPNCLIALQPENFTGASAHDKIAQVQHTLLVDRTDSLLVSDPHNMAWVFNIRGSDVAHTPIALGYALIPADGTPTLFINPAKISDFNREYLTSFAELAAPDELPLALRQASSGGRKIRLDSATASIYHKSLVEKSGGKADMVKDPITAMKAVKNQTEIEGSRAAHLRDGAALVQFLEWLDGATDITEIDAVIALEGFRRSTGKLKDISFPTISGFGANGAIVHYRVTEATDKPLTKGLFLIDSGGQYQDGTTDVTRTVSIGKPTSEMKDRFTRVLKGMIAISCARFPMSTTGAQIDVLARQFLWDIGLDFDHGTGHGVGSYLSVHEGPQRISKTGVVALEPGMILSNEPGFYKPKSYGIRIENLVLVEKSAHDGFLSFETLTLTPIDQTLILRSMLTKRERDWLNAYHARVYEEISPLVSVSTCTWLEKACAAL